MLAVTASPGPVWADGILEGMSGDVETTYSLLSSRATDASGTTTRTETGTYGARFNLRLNYNLLPKLNLNAGLAYDKSVTDQSGDADGETEVTRFRPSVWLTLRDPVLGGAVGYDLRDETVKIPGPGDSRLTRETYAASLDWRPADLPSAQVRYTRTATHDDPRAVVDTTEDFVFLKSEYLLGGLKLHYGGTYLGTEDAIHDVVSSQWSQEGNLAYETTFLDGRLSVATNDRVAFTEFQNVAQLPLPPVAGLSALDDTPLDGPPLVSTPALVDGDLKASAGLNLGYPGPGGDFTRRNMGLDFQTAVEVSRLQVWVDGWGPENLPADIATSFSWDIWVSTDNLTWTFHVTVPAVFGPFDRRFQIDFPPVTARYVKAVTRPLSGGIIGSTSSALYPNILVAELQAFVVGGGGEARVSGSQAVQNYNLDIKVILLRTPLLYYRFNGYYYRLDSGARVDSSRQTRYGMSHGLFVNHRFNPVFSTSANASFEVGREGDEARTAALYYASLAATPLKALTSSLVFSGNLQWVGEAATTSNSVTLHNVAELYRGIDATLTLGAVLTSDEQAAGPQATSPPPTGGVLGPPRPRGPRPGSLLDERAVSPAAAGLGQDASGHDGTTVRRDLYLNLGTGITPHRSLTMTAYYLGKLSHATGGSAGESRDTTEHRLDVGLSFTPLRTLSLSAAAGIASETGRDTTVRQSYGLSWAPFPDGRLQLSLYYAENQLPERSRIVQPALRWYLGSARRSYLEATYQFSTTDADSVTSESHLFSTGLRIFF